MLLHKKNLFASPEDKKTYEKFRETGVIIPHLHKHVSGQQLCSTCADGFRTHMKDMIYDRCRSIGGEDTFFHEFRGSGETMRFAFNSPLSHGVSKYGDPDVWGRMKTNEIIEVLGWADELKVSVEQHRLVHHWPCKAAISRDINLAGSIDLVIRGKLRIKQQVPNLCVGIDLFCDWGPNDHTIDLLKKEPYLMMLETDPAYKAQHEAWLAYVELVKQLPVLQPLKKAPHVDSQLETAA